MNAAKIIASIAVGVFSGLANAWDGSVTFYDNTFFSGQSLTVKISTTQRCFNIGCFNDRASSARWANLPSSGSFNGHSRITFYKDKDCSEHRSYKYWKTTDTYFPENFKRDGLDDAISSFMINDNWSFATSGIVTVCPFSARGELDLPSNWTVSEADAIVAPRPNEESPDNDI